jgi:glycosyltransferase involved in cell wall biosynthesis
MATGFVSVCIPTYNGQAYLEACLASACAQTWDELEILVVDDGSTDATVAIAEGFSARHPRLRVLRNDRNLGLVGNWNRCVEQARGEWIKFLFQDDVLEPDCVRGMMAVAHRPMVFCRRDFIFEDVDDHLRAITMRLTTEVSVQGVFGGGPDVTPEQVQAAVLEHFTSNMFGEPTSCLLHRSLFERFGLFDPRFVQVCDIEYWARAGIHTGFSYASDTLAHFRIHGQSTTARNDRHKALMKDSVDPLNLLHLQAHDAAYAPLRAFAASRGVDLRERYRDLLVRERLWGPHWHRGEWDDAVRRFPHLRIPLRWQVKRQLRRLLGGHAGRAAAAPRAG